MPESALRVTVDNLPGLALALGVGELDVVGDDVDGPSVLEGKERLEHGADGWLHTGRYYHEGDVGGLAVVVEVLEARVEADVCGERGNGAKRHGPYEEV